MAFQPLSVGDILMLSQTAWKIGRAFTSGKNSAPTEFAEVEREANSLSEALKLVAETLHSDGSILSHADDDTNSAVNTILRSAHKTLDDLDSFVDRYQVIRKKETNGGFVVERSWSDVVLANYRTFKWTTEGGDITELRNMLNMHTNSISLTMQALQSRSLSRLEKTVVPMAENILSIHDRVNGDLSGKIDDLHRIIMSLAERTPSITTGERTTATWGVRDSGSTVSTLDRASMNYHVESSDESNNRMLEPPPPRASSHIPPRNVARSPRGSATNFAGSYPTARSSREDSAYYGSGRVPCLDDVKFMDWDFETGAPIERRSSIGSPGCYGDLNASASPNDSAYAGTETLSRRGSHARRESATLPVIFKAVEERYDAVAGSSRGMDLYSGSPPGPPSSYGSPPSGASPSDASPRIKRSIWRSSTNTTLLPPPAISSDDEERPQIPATPASIFQRTRSNPTEARPMTAKSVKSGKSVQRASQPYSTSYIEGPKFEKQLFRNAAILCDVRGSRIEHAQIKPDEPDPRYNVEMIEACKEARICVVRKRENMDHGGTKIVTSVWCLTDDGETRLQQKLSEMQETVPYCSYFDPEKVSLQSTDAPIALRFHGEHWGGMLKEEIKTNWVNYYFVSENDAVAFQSAVFGRMLLGSYRTTKTIVIHEGLKGAFAFEEQFANIEMLRLWEDDGVSTPGAQGGVLALMHYSSNFGEGWARWWINNSNQNVKVKDDGIKHAKVKGIDVTVVRPPKVQTSVPTTDAQPKPDLTRAQPLKRVTGVRIEFKSEEERSKFVSDAKTAQMRSMPLPEL